VRETRPLARCYPPRSAAGTSAQLHRHTLPWQLWPGSRLARLPRAEIATMAGSKNGKSKSQKKKTPRRSAAKRAGPKKPKGRPKKKSTSAKKVVARTVSAKRALAKKDPPARKPASKPKAAYVATPPTPAPRQAPVRRATPQVPAPAPPLKTFSEKVRDCDRGTEVFFRVGDESVHGVILDRSALGAAVLTDAGLIDPGVIVPVPLGKLFESAEAERAAR
jgi:hypothetical protein